MSTTLVVRADANTEMGVGHVMRSLALAQAWQDANGKVIFAMATGVQLVVERLHSERIEYAELLVAPGSIEDASRTLELCRELQASWLAVDGFHFSQEFRHGVRKGPSQLLFLDDHGEFAPYSCDVVLNTNPYASEEMYPQREESTRFLLGPKYALLRREFLGHPPIQKDAPELARRLLVTFGGSDPHNVTLQVIDALFELKDLGLEVMVVAGSSNPHRTLLEETVREFLNAQILFNTNSMPRLMASADLAVSAGGGTCYELAYQRVPMFLITMAENHERTVQAWEERHAAINAGWFNRLDRRTLEDGLRRLITNRNLRRELVRNAAGVVDGSGARRVVQTMLRQPIGSTQ